MTPHMRANDRDVGAERPKRVSRPVHGESGPTAPYSDPSACAPPDGRSFAADSSRPPGCPDRPFARGHATLPPDAPRVHHTRARSPWLGEVDLCDSGP